MPVANMIKNWTKQHLDTYLTMAEMACLWMECWAWLEPI
jgi:arginine deiminase